MQKLLKFSLVLAIAGIFLIILLSNLIQPRLINISNINSTQPNEKVSFTGKITRVITLTPNFLLLKIENNNKTIDATLNTQTLNLNKNQTYLFTGRIQEYNHTLQVNLDKVQKYDP